MCGRFTLTSDLRALELRFNFRGDDLDYRPRYNVAPTQEVLTVTHNSDNAAQYMRWGLIPFWAKDLKQRPQPINAKAETLAESRMFKGLLQKSRCLVLADGFYEWRKDGDAKTPIHMVLKSQEPFAFAGLWGTWTNKETGDSLHSCTIITTEPNELTATIHNRMPVILSEEAERLWLDGAIQDPKVLGSILKPFPADSMDAYEVSSAVNSVKNHGPDLVIPV